MGKMVGKYSEVRVFQPTCSNDSYNIVFLLSSTSYEEFVVVSMKKIEMSEN